MQHIRRCSGPLRSQKGLSLFLGRKILKGVSDVGLAAFSTSMVAQRGALGNSVTRLPKSDYVRHFSANANHLTKDILRHNGIPAMYGGQPNREYLVSLRSSSQIMETHGESTINICFARSFASKASKKETHKQSETKKDVSTVEDPFDAPTYNIPEKPVTFTEGASYSIIILAGLGVAAAAAYAVFKELIFEPKEYKIFNKALKRIQDDSQVRVRIGSPITGYGQESRNRAARQRIPNRIFTDEDGVEHVQINFYIRGPHGAGKVSAEMFKDKVDKQWKYTYLIVEVMQPSRSQLILESYMPAPVAT
ncbi:probable mitochondrial import inner membrane translocase subunit TIM21 isoform X1 [Populus nigra]|uniref:probable mitochondrial import inner membrane translocase subunit TIM21 isoform X1 n=1 Tax=Populus nigra TaxID=3691 RepID=UPI002B27A2FD|nr:probable mitochondrial import inner membrane translocase subunit TIM21 isoform X1 [Populus nigra]